MQKIIINNFGPINHAEIELTKLVVLIGEQATGKSTIAKLIYFFKSLSNDFLSRYYKSNELEINYKNDIIFATREKFYDYFGSTFHMRDFSIEYFYGNQRSISLSLTDIHRLDVKLSVGFFKEYIDDLRAYKGNILTVRSEMEMDFHSLNTIDLERRQTIYLQNLSDKIDEIFCNVHNESSFILAGRNATIGYSTFFENMLSSNLQQIIENQGKRAFETKEQTIDETLMLDFLLRVSKMKQLMNKYGNFEGLIRTAPNDRQVLLEKAYSFIKKVIRGDYVSATDEKIILEGGKYVYLKNASSGQQESIRILQDAFVSLYTNNKIFRVIEEPEAHIFPEAQMYLLQLLVMLLNDKVENQMIITTHSPYVLSVINNLMYAHKVGQIDSAKVSQIVEQESWLNPQDVNAYMLTRDGAERIIDDELGMIIAERIDGVSRKLNEDYEKILDVEYGSEEK